MDDLETRLKTLLQERRGNWADIVTATEVSHSWLSKFVNGHIPNPGYATMKKVHAYLSPRQPKRASKPVLLQQQQPQPEDFSQSLDPSCKG